MHSASCLNRFLTCRQWLLSGSMDCSLRKWEISTGRCVRKWQFGASVRCVEWCVSSKRPIPSQYAELEMCRRCPKLESNIVSACVGNSVVVLNPVTGKSHDFSSSVCCLVEHVAKSESTSLTKRYLLWSQSRVLTSPSSSSALHKTRYVLFVL